MRAVLLAASVVLAVPAAPAVAGDHHGSSRASRARGDFRAAPSGFGVTIHRGGRHGDDAVVVDSGGFYYGGEWALYNNRTWESDSYNDWWHDKPERAFPRWVTSGQCARQWYAADTLRC